MTERRYRRTPRITLTPGIMMQPLIKSRQLTTLRLSETALASARLLYTYLSHDHMVACGTESQKQQQRETTTCKILRTEARYAFRGGKISEIAAVGLRHG